ncbi:hypothetical protein [Desulfobacula sp.]|uniref:hypothetical protein n=1 Tax=Desulfobacula sp. TaxID=2593537 RepID=UPI0019CD95B9|nr:hypothetical protein [Candidatus Brocadiales bacterium]MBL6995454.1 hypothetical protein [Desulfobacula sp.]
MDNNIKLPFLDKYSRVARLYPALITLVPVFLLTLGVTQNELTKILGDIMAIQVAGCISINVAALFLLIQANRFISKEIFERWYFEDELRMPTTEMLLPASTQMSPQFRSKVDTLCQRDFGLPLPTIEEQRKDDMLARRQITDIVAQIRQKVRDGTLLLQHNIEYGFVRNLIGGAPLGIIASIICALYFYAESRAVAIFSVVLVVLWSGLLLFSKTIIGRFGVLYAKRLIQEYVGGMKTK